MPDVIVTGLPRSGLTVAAAFIDYLPDSACLNEPMWQMRKATAFTDADAYCQWIAEDFATLRAKFLAQEAVRDLRSARGYPLMDTLRDPRRMQEDGKNIPVYFTKPGLSPHFTLAIKHHTLYTALLPELVKSDRFKIIAVLRNPLDVILSWQGLAGKRPFMEGKIPPVLYQYWPQAARVSNNKAPLLERMVHLYDAYCERYYEQRKQIHIIKYEELIKDPMLISKPLGYTIASPGVAMLSEATSERSLKAVEEIRQNIDKYCVFTKKFYA